MMPSIGVDLKSIFIADEFEVAISEAWCDPYSGPVDVELPIIPFQVQFGDSPSA
jgi:hypothetical protein